jgi:hypothetical protein
VIRLIRDFSGKDTKPTMTLKVEEVNKSVIQLTSIQVFTQRDMKTIGSGHSLEDNFESLQ